MFILPNLKRTSWFFHFINESSSSDHLVNEQPRIVLGVSASHPNHVGKIFAERPKGTSVTPAIGASITGGHRVCLRQKQVEILHGEGRTLSFTDVR